MNNNMNTIMNEALIILNDLHFIRADWFYAFIPLFLFLLLAYRQTTDNKNWQGVIDPQLLPFVLSKSAGKRRRYPLLLVFIAGSLCITALAGPVYKKLPQPVYREQSSLVILLDLSQSMNATDIKPSRLARAKLELLDLLKARKAGQTALIVYAADAFVVTPLTDDNATIANLVPALETDMMPAQGSNLAKALAKAFSLFSQSGIIKGDILLITDDVNPRDESAIKKVSSQGHRLSIFGIGTRDGGPIPLDAEAGGGFLQDSHGAIVIPKLQPQKLQRYALTGGGLYTSLQAGDEDVNKLSALFQSSEIAQEKDQDSDNNLNADVWQEEGHWLLLPLLFLAALWARRGWLAIVLLFILPLPQPAYAAAIDSEHLWSSPDQQAMKAFNNGDLEQAAKSFTRPEWKASALYRKGDYEAAAKTLEKIDSSDSQYNRGNALAKQGKLEDALKAYDKALELDKNNADAQYNREQVKQALEKQKQDQQQNKQQNDQQQDDKEQDGQKDDQKQNDQKQDGQQQDQQSQDSQQQDSEQQKDQQNDQQQGSGQKQQDDSQQSDKQSEQQSDEQSAEQSDDKQQQNKDEKNQQQQSGQKKENKEQQQMEQEQLKQRDAKAEAEQQKKEQQQYQKDQQQDQQDQSAEEQQQQQADKEVENKDSDEKPMEVEVNPIEASITEEEKATEQWLKRIPDDPGGLLRRKFYYQYKQIPNQTDSEQPW